MLLYISIIFISMVMIAAINIIFTIPIYDFSVLYVIGAVVISAFAAFVVDAIVAYIIHKMPPKYYSPYKKIFQVGKFERKIYEFLGVKKWKDIIPEMGQLCDFKKNKLESTEDNEYLYKFLVETCYAETLHLLSGILGYCIIFIYPLKYALLFGVPIASVNFFLQILPVIIQRYLRPKLLKIYERNIKISQKMAEAA